MERGKPQAAWSSLDTLLTAGTLGNLADGELLDCFRSHSNAAGHEAFRILVERHGAMVLGLCRSLVRDPHEAEDAFQATFLVLVRRADSIRQRETIGPWLYGVACRVARRAQIRSARRRKREVAADVDLPARDGSNVEASGTDQAVHEEIRRLPESLRAPLILCCLEGQSYDLAARRLGVREPTLRGRLHRARKTLESRLRRRGILAPTVAGLLDPGSLSLGPLPSSLIESTTQFAVRWSTLRGLLVGAGAVPETIAALAQGVIQAMFIQTVKVCGIAAVLTVGVVGTLVVAQQEKIGGDDPASGGQCREPADQKGPAAEPAKRTNGLDLERRRGRSSRSSMRTSTSNCRSKTDAQPLPQGGQAGDDRRPVHRNPHLRRSGRVTGSRRDASRLMCRSIGMGSSASSCARRFAHCDSRSSSRTVS